MFRSRRTLPRDVQEYLDAAAPARSVPWRVAPYTVLDIETSGLDARRDAILAIGAVDVEDGQILLDRCWQTLVRPPAEQVVAPEAIEIHQLLRADVDRAPPLDAVLPELLRRLQGRVLVVHVAAIDVAFLDSTLQQIYRTRLRGPVLDTARLATALKHDERFLTATAHPITTLALAALAAQVGLPAFPAHNALNDALTTAQLFLALATRSEQHGAKTLGALLRRGGCR
jgi:DNA polymerase-3 subunit epsilon